MSSTIWALTDATSAVATQRIPVATAEASGSNAYITPAYLAAYVAAAMTAISITGGTVTSSTPVLDATQTWSTTATYTGIKLNITDSGPSNAASLLMDLQVGGTSKFKVQKDGSIFLSTASTGVTTGAGIAALSTADVSIYTAAARRFAFSGTALVFLSASPKVSLQSDTAPVLAFGASEDVILTRAAAATLQHGAADAAAPVAQTISFQSVVAGTSNTAGVNATFKSSAGTGTGAGGSLIFQVAPAGSTGSTQNTFSTALTIDSTRLVQVTGSFVSAGTFSLKAGLNNSGNNVLLFGETTGASPRLSINPNNGLIVGSGLGYAWNSSSGAASFATGDSTVDLILARDAANTLALRNGTSAQTFRAYNTYTDSSNGEWGTFDWATSNVLTIGTNKNGTGSTRNLRFVVGGTNVLDYGVTVASTWSMTGAIYTSANGSASACAYATGAVNSGVYFDSGWGPAMAAGGTAIFAVNGTYGIVQRSTGLLSWSASALASLPDLSLTRNAAGVVKVTNQGGSGAGTVLYTPATIANLPAAPSNGMVAAVTDANAPAVGSTVASGGSAKALVWYNGANWTVIGV